MVHSEYVQHSSIIVNLCCDVIKRGLTNITDLVFIAPDASQFSNSVALELRCSAGSRWRCTWTRWNRDVIRESEKSMPISVCGMN